MMTKLKTMCILMVDWCIDYVWTLVHWLCVKKCTDSVWRLVHWLCVKTGALIVCEDWFIDCVWDWCTDCLWRLVHWYHVKTGALIVCEDRCVDRVWRLVHCVWRLVHWLYVNTGALIVCEHWCVDCVRERSSLSGREHSWRLSWTRPMTVTVSRRKNVSNLRPVCQNWLIDWTMQSEPLSSPHNT